MRHFPLLVGTLAFGAVACAGGVDPEDADFEIEGTFADSALAPDATLQPAPGLAPDATLQPDAGLAPSDSLQEPSPE
jgi:hypothetical protein